ncbi:MAG: enoyl-CoA hydratase/isomerase family protein [Rubrivivax sp.]|nr:enoyl-CoA hydratase/isomerase family protein [Rubrivivax sp.]
MSPEDAPEARTWEALHVHRDGAVLHVTLNRPDARNAMTMAMVRELRQVLSAAQAGKLVRVLVLRGAGGHFCAGADLKDMVQAQARAAQGDDRDRQIEPSADPIADINARFGELCVAYAATGLATVAVLEGTVMGGGFGLACVADVALASDDVAFRLPETSLGVLPAQIAPFLTERLGYSQAKRLAVTGGRLGAAQALGIGLVHEVHESSQLDAAVARVCSEILQCAPGAIASTKALLAQGRLLAPAAMISTAAAAFSRAARGPEGVEGMSAAVARRKPSWAPPA